jgi:hypothetical protein
MAEEYVAIRNRSIVFEGVFSLKDTYSLIETFLKERGYEHIDKVHEYKMFETDTVVEKKMAPTKKLSDSESYEIEIGLKATNLVPIKTPQGDMHLKGKIKIALTGTFNTDIDNRFPSGALLVLRYLADLILLKDYRDSQKKIANKDVDDLYALLLNYFGADFYQKKI